MSGLRIGSLFAGVGGLELGLERAGVGKTVWQVEIDPYCQAVLEAHWPEARRHGDIRTFEPEPGSADLLAGGFPCQDISQAGNRAGLAGKRSGLWRKFAGTIRVVGPRFVVVENVAALLDNGMGTVLGDLATLGFDAEWDCLPAAACGAPHRRDRVFIVAHANGGGHLHGQAPEQPAEPRLDAQREPVAGGQDVAHANGQGLFRTEEQRQGRPLPPGRGRPLADPLCFGLQARESLVAWKDANSTGEGWWATEPRLGRVAHGVPHWMDRIRCLGNGVSPLVSEFIGRRMMTAFAIEGGLA